MPNEILVYQVRHLTDGEFPEKVETIECADSGEALRKAWIMMGATGVEIWCGDRFIGRLEPPSH